AVAVPAVAVPAVGVPAVRELPSAPATGVPPLGETPPPGLPPCVPLGDLTDAEARQARARYGIADAVLAEPDARHPLTLRLLAEVRAAAPGAPCAVPLDHHDVFSAYLDLMSLRVAVRLAAENGLRGTAVRRLAAKVSGQVHEAARRSLGPRQGELDRGSFEEVFPRGTAPARRKDPEGGDMTVREGLAFFARRPRLVALAGITGVSAVFGRNYGLTLAVLVTGPLAGGAGSFGTVSTVLAVGGIVGAVLGARLRKPSVRLVGALAATGGLLQAVAGLSPSLAVLLLLVLPMAVVESVSDTAGTTVLQTDPPAHLRGRVLGVWGSISTGWGLAGPPALGLLMELAGARGALVAGGLIIAGAIGTGHLLRQRRTPTPVTPLLTEERRPALETAA
ncbi:MFS transporter, partial [Streptomyces glaucescens]|uniref:MFS transporter n=1 Tax=Streptomyces glaucescens TaxID=1907 RepID=UPI001FE9F7EE